MRSSYSSDPLSRDERDHERDFEDMKRAIIKKEEARLERDEAVEDRFAERVEQRAAQGDSRREVRLLSRGGGLASHSRRADTIGGRPRRRSAASATPFFKYVLTLLVNWVIHSSQAKRVDRLRAREAAKQERQVAEEAAEMERRHAPPFHSVNSFSVNLFLSNVSSGVVARTTSFLATRTSGTRLGSPRSRPRHASLPLLLYRE